MNFPPRNILVRMPNWVGDLVMATAALADLRTLFPNASITAMCLAPLCDLLKEDPAIDELFCFTRPSNKFLRREEHRNIIAKIRGGQFDTALLFTNSFSSAWLCWQGGISRRIGYSGSLRTLLLTDRIPFPREKMHQVDLYKNLLAPLGAFSTKTKPRLYLTQKEVEASKDLLRQRGYDPKKPLIGIHPGASYGSAKRWPVGKFRLLASQLAGKGNLVFFGDGEAGGMIKEICAGVSGQVINLAGGTSLRELACLIKDCDLFITNDSGPMHIAAAFDTPLIALFGSTDPEATGPYGKIDAVICKKVPCSPCFKRVCPIDLRCMEEISVEEVVQKASLLLAKFRP